MGWNDKGAEGVEVQSIYIFVSFWSAEGLITAVII